MGNLIHIETTLGALVRNRRAFNLSKRPKRNHSVRFGPHLPDLCFIIYQNREGFCCVDGGAVTDRLANWRKTVVVSIKWWMIDDHDGQGMVLTINQSWSWRCLLLYYLVSSWDWPLGWTESQSCQTVGHWSWSNWWWLLYSLPHCHWTTHSDAWNRWC